MKSLAHQICSTSIQSLSIRPFSLNLPNNIKGLKCEGVGRDIHIIPEKGYTNSLIWMHGLGDSPLGFLDIFYSRLSPVPLMSTKVILLCAPYCPVTLNGGMEMNSWFDILSIDDGLKAVKHDDIISNSKMVYNHIEEESKILKDSSKVFVGGFSQGCSMALYAGLMYKSNVGGIIGLSGTYFDDIIKPTNEKKQIPIFYYIGESDMVVHYDHAKYSLSPLIENKYKVEFHSEAWLEHSISEKELATLKKYCDKYFI